MVSFGAADSSVSGLVRLKKNCIAFRWFQCQNGVTGSKRDYACRSGIAYFFILSNLRGEVSSLRGEREELWVREVRGEEGWSLNGMT